MNAPADPSGEDSSAGRIEAMLAGFRTAPPAPTVTAAAPAPAAQRRPQDDAVRPLWQAEGGRAAARRSPWWQTGPVWALVGLLVGIAGSQGWQALRQQEQRDVALASSIGRTAPEPVAAASPLTAVVPVPVVPVVTESPPAAPVAPVAPVAGRPARPDSPAARCKQLKGAEFQRCLQAQCRKDRFFAHRHCVALYERNARP